VAANRIVKRRYPIESESVPHKSKSPFLYNSMTKYVLTLDEDELIKEFRKSKNPSNAMKILKKLFASRLRWCRVVLVLFFLAGLVVKSEAVIYTVTSGSYSAAYDSSQNGYTLWSGGAVNQLALQSLYASINGGPVSPLTGAVVNTGSSGFSGKYITATYSTAAGSISDTLTISGSTLSESIQFANLTASTASVSIFQYSDFVLGGSGAAGSQTVNLTPAPVSGGYAVASQSGGGYTLTWQGDAPGFTTLVQANSSGAPFGAFIGSGSDLNNSTLAAVNTQAVFGYEFSGSVLSSGLLSVSETSSFAVVPEPSALALASAGMCVLALAFRRWRKQEFSTKVLGPVKITPNNKTSENL